MAWRPWRPWHICCHPTPLLSESTCHYLRSSRQPCLVPLFAPSPGTPSTHKVSKHVPLISPYPRPHTCRVARYLSPPPTVHASMHTRMHMGGMSLSPPSYSSSALAAVSSRSAHCPRRRRLRCCRRDDGFGPHRCETRWPETTQRGPVTMC